eukprot:TRINITY_DN10175_c0_g7_i1.p1 TRINITY_DN10175_c0_g7~~TRINITY_DN10175_c0_g7_i1.p1  ORF type:complete len:172 (-),score=33.64 TRINITY_DN10175_c0_g7_i1:1142-1657(-)
MHASSAESAEGEGHPAVVPEQDQDNAVFTLDEIMNDIMDEVAIDQERKRRRRRKRRLSATCEPPPTETELLTLGDEAGEFLEMTDTSPRSSTLNQRGARLERFRSLVAQVGEEQVDLVSWAFQAGGAGPAVSGMNPSSSIAGLLRVYPGKARAGSSSCIPRTSEAAPGERL